MRNKTSWVRVPLSELETVLNNLRAAKAFAGHYGFNTEYVNVRVATRLDPDDVPVYTYEVQVPKHAWDNLEYGAAVERLFEKDET